jgi:putative CocE/NonD family hydrolase
VTVAGPIEVTLHISSSAKDTDFMVKLVDVYPDGKVINLNDDAFRVRYREGFDKVVLLEPGEVVEITLPNMVMGNSFGVGHRIGLQIASSDFPLYERNLNTGGNNYDESVPVVAENTVHHGPAHPSRMRLPVLPE